MDDSPITAMWAGGEKWRADDVRPLQNRFGHLLHYGVLASAQTPFDPMDKAFHALGVGQLAAAPKRVLRLGIRPSLRFACGHPRLGGGPTS